MENCDNRSKMDLVKQFTGDAWDKPDPDTFFKNETSRHYRFGLSTTSPRRGYDEKSYEFQRNTVKFKICSTIIKKEICWPIDLSVKGVKLIKRYHS